MLGRRHLVLRLHAPSPFHSPWNGRAVRACTASIGWWLQLKGRARTTIEHQVICFPMQCTTSWLDCQPCTRPSRIRSSARLGCMLWLTSRLSSGTCIVGTTIEHNSKTNMLRPTPWVMHPNVACFRIRSCDVEVAEKCMSRCGSFEFYRH